MKKSIFIRFVAVIFLSLLLCTAICGGLLHRVLLASSVDEMQGLLRLVDYSLSDEQVLSEQLGVLNDLILDDRSRLTVIDFNGAVLYDTRIDSSYLDNHASRKEITEALQEGEGSDVRRSASLGSRMLYVCRKSEEHGFLLRLSVPFKGVWEYFPSLLPAILASFIIALSVSVLISGRFAKSISKPLAEISDEFAKMDTQMPVFDEYRYDELNLMAISAEKLYKRFEKTFQELKFEKYKIDSILENMEEGILLLDGDLNVITFNHTAREIMQSPDGRPGRNIYYYTANLSLTKAIERAGEAGGQSVEIAAEGKIFMAHVSKIVRAEKAYKIEGTIVLFIDITREKNEQKLRQEFFTNASHELKTPLTSIQGYTELLSEGMVKDEQQRNHFLALLRAEIKNMASLINDILMISRLESRADDTHMDQVNFAEILTACTEALAPMASEYQVTVETECPDAPLELIASPIHLRQLLNNLVSNGIKYNQPGGRVLVRAERQGDTFMLTVTDTGIGIPKEAQGRIFERFYRVDKGRSERVPGTGLGLSIVKHIVNFYHGEIKMNSAPGSGTTFHIHWRI